MLSQFNDLFSRISGEGHIRELKNLAKIITMIALLKKKKNSRILNFVESSKMSTLRKFKLAKITRSIVMYF